MSDASAAPAPQPGDGNPAAAPAAPANVNAPAPAPAAPPAQDPNVPAPLNVDEPKAPPTPAPDETVEVLYSKTGDTGLDLALTFVGKLGFGPERPEIVAAQKGDFAPLEASLKALGDKAKGFEQYVNVAKDSYKRSVDTKKSAADATQKAVVEAVGGVQNWNAIHAWVVAEADNEQKDAINAAFEKGGFAATAMATQLAHLYAQSGVSTQKPKGVVKDTATSASAADSGKLDRKQFTAEVRKLESQYGYRLTETQEYKALSARYLAGLNQQ